jgi:hypothetical protein
VSKISPRPSPKVSRPLTLKHHPASAGNCQTQDLTILEQMRRGSRYFDIRPVLGDGGKYLMGHYSTDSIKAGCNGGSLDDLVSDTNK